MPGTTYTRTGPELDPVGRLADFARFAVDELAELTARVYDITTEGPTSYRAARHAARARAELARVAELLEGYTTADD